MRTKFLIIFVFFIISNTFAQTISKENLIGKWEVVKVISTLDQFEELDKEELDEANAILIAFKNCNFNFEEDNKFRFDIDFELLDKGELIWKYNELTQEIIIEDKSDDKNGIFVEIKMYYKNEELFFKIEETPFNLRLKKEKKI